VGYRRAVVVLIVLYIIGSVLQLTNQVTWRKIKKNSELRLNQVEGTLTVSLNQLGYQAKPLPRNLLKPAKTTSKTKS
jgi:hypothetical protein